MIKNIMITYLCDPDFNVYTMSRNEAPDGAKSNGRGAGQVKARILGN